LAKLAAVAELQESTLAKMTAAAEAEASARGAGGAAEFDQQAEFDQRLKEEQQKVAAAYEEDLDEMDRRLSGAEKALEECAAEKQRVSLQLEMTSLRLRENTLENTRLRDQLGAKAAEVSRLIDDHGRARLEWATRLRESETLAAKAQGLSESLTSRLQSLESIQSSLAACREKLHEHEIALARVQAERDAARQLAERTQVTLANQERELFEGLKTLRDMQRTLRRG
jgi:predicted  nucleic acid-binding Zn-ribbon protein